MVINRGNGMEGTSLRKFGKIIGVSGPAVTKAVAKGRLNKSVGYTLRGKKRVPFIKDIDQAIGEWRANTSARGRSPRIADNEAPVILAPGVEPVCDQPPELHKGSSIAECERVRAYYAAKTIELKYQQGTGELIPMEESLEVMKRLLTPLRSGLINLTRYTPELANITDPDEMGQRLQEITGEILGEVNQFYADAGSNIRG